MCRDKQPRQKILQEMVRQNGHRVEAFQIKLADILVQYNYDTEEEISLSTADECERELISNKTFKACYCAHLVSYQTIQEIELVKCVGYCRIIWCHQNYKLSLLEQITPNSVSEYVVKHQKKEKTATKKFTSQKEMKKKAGKILKNKIYHLPTQKESRKNFKKQNISFANTKRNQKESRKN